MQRSIKVLLTLLPALILAGFITALLHPVIALATVVGVVAVVQILHADYKVFWYYLIFILLGYLFLGKGFAYIGVNAIYISELGLGLIILSLLLLLPKREQLPVRPMRLELGVLLLAMVWGAIRTVPYLATYRLTALRDAVIWGYGVFAIGIYFLLPEAAIRRFFSFYNNLVPFVLVWALLGLAIFRSQLIAFGFPGSPEPLLVMKSGDTAVHLAGAGAFILLRLDRNEEKQRHTGAIWLLWILWGTAWLVHATINRGGGLSALAGLLVVFLLRPKTRWDRLVVIGLVAVLLLLITNLNVAIPGAVREISFEQIKANFLSIFAGSIEGGSGNLQVTKQWRLDWWQKIVDYTLGGEYFWTGKGYGVNLATEDGFQVIAGDRLRSPHNIYMTFLARSGVPGLFLWLLFIGTLVFRLWKAARQADNREKADYAVWLLAYLAAFLVSASFDVFIEAPTGGIWFWSLAGIALVYFSTETGQQDENPHHPQLPPAARR